jgi:hypothetical protein
VSEREEKDRRREEKRKGHRGFKVACPGGGGVGWGGPMGSRNFYVSALYKL